MNRKILITGSSGFIGKNIVEIWKDKYEIYAPGSEELNLLDQKCVESYLQRTDFDIVIHTAKRDNILNDISRFDMLDANLRMFYNLIKYSDYFGRMYYLGSGAEYNRERMSPMVREEELGRFIPTDPYGFSKYIMAEETLKSKNIYELCLFGVFGKYEVWEKRFISNAICRVLQGQPIKIQQNVYFDYIWVEDLIQIFEWFIEKEPKQKRYNICRGEKIDLYSLACMVKEMLHSDCKIFIERDGLKREYTGNNNRFLKEMNGFIYTEWKKSIKQLILYYDSIL